MLRQATLIQPIVGTTERVKVGHERGTESVGVRGGQGTVIGGYFDQNNCMYVYMYAYVCACMFVYMCVYVYACMYACMHACMHICMYVYAYMCVRM